MSTRQTYPESGRFERTRNGHANRVDRDAKPSVLLVGMSPCGQTARLHFAGEPNLRIARISDLSGDLETIEGMSPADAFKIGRGAANAQ